MSGRAAHARNIFGVMPEGEEWHPARILGTWAVNYYGNKLVQLKESTREKISIFAT